MFFILCLFGHCRLMSSKLVSFNCLFTATADDNDVKSGECYDVTDDNCCSQHFINTAEWKLRRLQIWLVINHREDFWGISLKKSNPIFVTLRIRSIGDYALDIYVLSCKKHSLYQLHHIYYLVLIDIDKKNFAKIDNYYHLPFIVKIIVNASVRSLKRRIKNHN